MVAGIPGVTSPPQLLKFALACGIGPSVEVLRKQSGGLLKLATTRLWKPDGAAEGIARSTLDDPDSLIGACTCSRSVGSSGRPSGWPECARRPHGRRSEKECGCGRFSNRHRRRS